MTGKQPTIKLYSVLQAIVCCSFLALFVALSYFNRFAVDDFYYIRQFGDNGFFNTLAHTYQFEDGRWASRILSAAVFMNSQYPVVLMLYSCLMLAVFLLTLNYLIKNLFRLSGIVLAPATSFFYAAVFCCCMFFVSLQVGEIWFWANSTFMYLDSVIAFVAGLAIITGAKTKIWHYFILLPAFVFIGGASEAYAAIIIMVLFMVAIVLYLIRSDKKTTYINFSPLKSPFSSAGRRTFATSFHPPVGEPSRSLSCIEQDSTSKISLLTSYFNSGLYPKLIIALLFCLAAFVVNYLSAGSRARMNEFPDHNLLYALYISARSLARLGAVQMLPQLPYLILFTMPWIFLGHIYNKSAGCDLKKMLMKFILSLGGLMVFLFICLFPTSYFMSEAPPDRALSLIIFFITVFFSAWAFYIGYKVRLKEKVIKVATVLCLTGCVFVLLFSVFSQFSVASGYAAALDARTRLLKTYQANGNREVVELAPLPSSGFLYSTEITPSIYHYRNTHYKRGLYLDFDIKLKE